MADKDDVFKRYLEAGLSFFEMTQQRAEAALKDLAGSGESAKGQAQKAVDWVKERGRQGTDELRDLVKNEIRSQVDTLGLATKDDVARLEARLDGLEAARGTAAATKAPTKGPTKAPTKAAAITKSSTTEKKKASATKVPAMKKAASPAPRATPPVARPGRAPDTTPDQKA